MAAKRALLIATTTNRGIAKHLSDRKIPAFKVGGTWRFRKSEIESWIFVQEILLRESK